MKTFRPVPKPAPREKKPRPPKVRKRVKQGPPKVQDRAYLDWIKTRPCLVIASGRECRGTRCCFQVGRRIEPAHVKTRGSGGADRGNVVPLCPQHHDEQEGDTEGFEKVYGVSLKLAAAELLVEYIKAGEP